MPDQILVQGWWGSSSARKVDLFATFAAGSIVFQVALVKILRGLVVSRPLCCRSAWHLVDGRTGLCCSYCGLAHRPFFL